MTPLSPILARGTPVVEGSMLTLPWFGWLSRLSGLLVSGYTGTITTAKLTGGGTEGSMTFVNGILVSQTQAT